MLADLARTDAHNHRQVAGDSDLGEAVKVLAQSHQSLIGTRQRQANQLRSVLREFYPAALVAFDQLTSRDALAVLSVAPSPTAGRALSKSKIAATLRRAGRQRRVEEATAKIQTVLRSEQLAAPDLIADAMAASVTALVAVIVEINTQIDVLETKLADRFNNTKSRKNYSGMSPITRASGKTHVVLARFARNKRLADACYQWAFATLTASPDARQFYDQRRAAGDTHNRALRALGNRWVGILHGCLHHHTNYDADTAWAHRRLAGESPTEIAVALGRTTRWVRKRVARHYEDGYDDRWARSRSRAPISSPTRTPRELEEQILADRRGVVRVGSYCRESPATRVREARRGRSTPPRHCALTCRAAPSRSQRTPNTIESIRTVRPAKLTGSRRSCLMVPAHSERLDMSMR